MSPTTRRLAGTPEPPAREGALRFTFTVLYVPDLIATLGFYAAAFGLPARFVHPSGQYAELETGAVTIAFTQDELAVTALTDLPGGYHRNRPTSAPPGVDLAFATDDVDAACARAVSAGAAIVSPVVVKPWGQRVGYLRDLNGVLIEIGTPVDLDRDPTPSVP